MKRALHVVALGVLILAGTLRCNVTGEPRPGRYQVVYGEIGGYTDTNGRQYGAFIKIDTATGETWIYRGGVPTAWTRMLPDASQ